MYEWTWSLEFSELSHTKSGATKLKFSSLIAFARQENQSKSGIRTPKKIKLFHSSYRHEKNMLFCKYICTYVLCTNTRMFFMHTYTNAHTRLFCAHIHECFYTYTCTLVYIYTYVLYTMHAFLQACNHQVTVTWKGIISTYCFKKQNCFNWWQISSHPQYINHHFWWKY